MDRAARFQHPFELFDSGSIAPGAAATDSLGHWRARISGLIVRIRILGKAALQRIASDKRDADISEISVTDRGRFHNSLYCDQDERLGPAAPRFFTLDSCARTPAG